MRGERREKQPPDYAPRGAQCGSIKKHTSAHKHIHFKHDLQWGGGDLSLAKSVSFYKCFVTCKMYLFNINVPFIYLSVSLYKCL